MKDQIKSLKAGKSATFEKDGVSFTVKKHNGNVYSLNASNVKTRNRWGTLTEIVEDLEHCLTYGSLPRPNGARW